MIKNNYNVKSFLKILKSTLETTAWKYNTKYLITSGAKEAARSLDSILESYYSISDAHGHDLNESAKQVNNILDNGNENDISNLIASINTLGREYLTDLNYLNNDLNNAEKNGLDLKNVSFGLELNNFINQIRIIKEKMSERKKLEGIRINNKQLQESLNALIGDFADLNTTTAEDIKKFGEEIKKFGEEIKKNQKDGQKIKSLLNDKYEELKPSSPPS